MEVTLQITRRSCTGTGSDSGVRRDADDRTSVGVEDVGFTPRRN